MVDSLPHFLKPCLNFSHLFWFLQQKAGKWQVLSHLQQQRCLVFDHTFGQTKGFGAFLRLRWKIFCHFFRKCAWLSVTFLENVPDFLSAIFQRTYFRRSDVRYSGTWSEIVSGNQSLISPMMADSQPLNLSPIKKWQKIIQPRKICGRKSATPNKKAYSENQSQSSQGLEWRVTLTVEPLQTVIKHLLSDCLWDEITTS